MYRNISFNYCLKLFFTLLLSILLTSTYAETAQRSSKASKARKLSKQTTASSTGKISAIASLAPGTAEVVLENYVGAPLKAMQFRIIVKSVNLLTGVVAGSSIADGKVWSFNHTIKAGKTDASGKIIDTVNVVIFGNGWNTLEAVPSIKLVDLKFEKSKSTDVSTDVSVKIIGLLGALQDAKAADIKPGPEVSLNLWK